MFPSTPQRKALNEAQPSEYEQTDDYSHTSIRSTPTSNVFTRSKNTPGQKLTEDMSIWLFKKTFVDVFGTEVVDSWSIKWDVFEQKLCPLDSASTQLQLRRLKERTQKVATSKDEAFLTFKVIKIVDSLPDLELERLEQRAKHYFTNLFQGNAMIHSYPKKSGVQMGCILEVHSHFGKEKKQKYYVKTHSQGNTISDSTGRDKVDLCELMVYKILERLRFMPEVHFIGRDCKEFYIATLDANEYGSFYEFDKIVDASSEHHKVLESVCGNLVKHVATLERERKLNAPTDVDNIQLDQIAKEFIDQVTMIDLLCRMFFLTDLLMNYQNFGFLLPNRRLIVLDFRCSLQDFTSCDFEYFLLGNGKYKYYIAHPCLRYPLRSCNVSKRASLTFEILTSGPLQHLETVAKEVAEEIRAICSSNNLLDDLVQELDNTLKVMVNNIDTFKSYLKKFVTQ
ncbi:hypothetical protein C9374_005139 [Naegleria lovaniensis]|uniref:Uncharacterized protein n=1 Tax=Naegleria lovaniensis TaxID=51637 RepID=A0AA88GKE6_NAELO|nr:uncharacterized protein C9374_005139 [Naegleria lovaniensis]KAG2382559.1 hypothetical protein C9374_005139 [Naegleria lovaniensis]